MVIKLNYGLNKKLDLDVQKNSYIERYLFLGAKFYYTILKFEPVQLSLIYFSYFISF